MSQIINTNVMSLNAQKNLSRSNGMLATAMQRLSSGLRINSAKDDAAGLAITERQTAQIRGMNQAIRNANDGISLGQTAEAALVEVTNNMHRMRELAIQSANGVYSKSDRVSMQKEVLALQEEVGRTLQIANFNNRALFFQSGDSFITSMGFHIGANQGVSVNASTDPNRINFSLLFKFSVAGNGVRGSVNGLGSLGGIGSASLFSALLSARIFGYDAGGSGVFGGGISTSAGAVEAGSVLSIATISGAQYAINWIDAGINIVNDVRSSFGALQNRFESTVRNLQDSVEATEASRSRIRDADFAMETAALTRAQILQQAGVAMLAQANQVPQGVLQLLQG